MFSAVIAPTPENLLHLPSKSYESTSPISTTCHTQQIENLKCGKLWRNTSHSICMFRRCHGKEEGGKKGAEQAMKWHLCGCSPVFVCVVLKGERAALVWARTFVAALTSRGQCESYQFILSSSHPKTTAESFKIRCRLIPPPLLFPFSSLFSCNFYSRHRRSRETFWVWLHAISLLVSSLWNIFLQFFFIFFSPCVPVSPTLLSLCDWT